MRWRGVFTTDKDLVVHFWDAELGEVTGIPSEEAQGKSLVHLFPEIAERGLVDKFRRVIESGVVETLAPAFHQYLIPCPPRAPSSRFTYMQQWVVIAPLRQGEEIVGTIVSLEDVTERSEGTESSPAEEALIAGLGERDWRLRRKALDGLSRATSYQTVRRIIESIRNHHDDVSILNSVLQILAISEADTGPYLKELLREEDRDLRIYAALLLGERRDKRATDDLIKALHDPDANVRFHVIEALGKIRAPEAVEPLVDIVVTRDFFLSFPALNALAEIGERRVVEKIVPFLKDPFLCLPAAEALGRLGDEKVVIPLVETLRNHATPVVSIVRALEEIYERYEKEFGEGDYITELVQKAMDEEGIRRLLDSLKEAAQEDLKPIVRLLGWLRGEEVVKAILNLLGRPELGEEVIKVLTRYGQKVVPLIIQQLRSGDLETRKAAVIALGRIGDRESVPALIEALSDHPEIAVCAAGAIAKIGDRRAFRPLVELMGHPQTSVRQAVVGALNSIGHPDMPEVMEGLLKSPDPRVRESAVRVAGYFGYDNCRELMILRADDEVEGIRRVAVEHLPYLEDERISKILIKKVKEDTPSVRAQAARALAMVPDPEAIECLMVATDDPDPWVRFFAIQSLGQLGIREALPLAMRLIDRDPAGQVKIAAVRTLGMLGGQEGVEILVQVAQGEDDDLAEEAINALEKIAHPHVQEILPTFVRSENKRRRMATIKALARHLNSSALELLTWRLLAGDEEEIQAVMHTLCASRLPEAVRALVYVSQQPSRRDQIVGVLARQGDEVIDVMEEIFRTAQGEVKRILCEVFMRMKSVKATEMLISALKDEDPKVRLTAVQALVRIGSRRGEKVLLYLAANDPSPEVREAASRARSGNHLWP